MWPTLTINWEKRIYVTAFLGFCKWFVDFQWHQFTKKKYGRTFQMLIDVFCPLMWIYSKVLWTKLNNSELKIRYLFINFTRSEFYKFCWKISRLPQSKMEKGSTDLRKDRIFFMRFSLGNTPRSPECPHASFNDWSFNWDFLLLRLCRFEPCSSSMRSECAASWIFRSSPAIECTRKPKTDTMWDQTMALFVQELKNLIHAHEFANFKIGSHFRFQSTVVSL